MKGLAKASMVVKMTQKAKTHKMVLTAMFTAIIIAMAFVPYMGYIPLGFMNATIIHIPVIIGAIVLGPKIGAFLGGIFGLTSMINNTINTNLTSFVFSPFYSVGEVHGNLNSVIICIVPRVLIGVVAYYVYKAVSINGIYFLFGSSYAAAKGIMTEALYGVILGVIGTQGIPEAVVAGVLVSAITKAILKVANKSSLLPN